MNVGKVEITGDLWENHFSLQEWGWDGREKREGNVGQGGAGAEGAYRHTRVKQNRVVPVFVDEQRSELAWRKREGVSGKEEIRTANSYSFKLWQRNNSDTLEKEKHSLHELFTQWINNYSVPIPW